jgi:hypothetical protein
MIGPLVLRMAPQRGVIGVGSGTSDPFLQDSLGWRTVALPRRINAAKFIESTVAIRATAAFFEPVIDDPEHQNAHGDRHPILKLNAEHRKATNQPLSKSCPHKKYFKDIFRFRQYRYGDRALTDGCGHRPRSTPVACTRTAKFGRSRAASESLPEENEDRQPTFCSVARFPFNGKIYSALSPTHCFRNE